MKTRKCLGLILGLSIMLSPIIAVKVMKGGFLVESYPNNLDAIRVGTGMLCLLVCVNIIVSGIRLIVLTHED